MSQELSLDVPRSTGDAPAEGMIRKRERQKQRQTGETGERKRGLLLVIFPHIRLSAGPEIVCMDCPKYCDVSRRTSWIFHFLLLYQLGCTYIHTRFSRSSFSAIYNLCTNHARGEERVLQQPGTVTGLLSRSCLELSKEKPTYHKKCLLLRNSYQTL